MRIRSVHLWVSSYTCYVCFYLRNLHTPLLFAYAEGVDVPLPAPARCALFISECSKFGLNYRGCVSRNGSRPTRFALWRRNTRACGTKTRCRRPPGVDTPDSDYSLCSDHLDRQRQRKARFRSKKKRRPKAAVDASSDGAKVSRRSQQPTWRGGRLVTVCETFKDACLEARGRRPGPEFLCVYNKYKAAGKRITLALYRCAHQGCPVRRYPSARTIVPGEGARRAQ